MEEKSKKKSKGLAIVLSILFGILGVDRFYYGYYFTGMLKLLTLGGAGIWWLIDIILIASGKLRPKAEVLAEGGMWFQKAIKKRTDELQEKYDQQEAAHKRWIDALNQKLRTDGFSVSGERWCNDIRIEKPIEGQIKGEVLWQTSKGFLMDNKNRRMAFVWLGDTPRVKYINYGDVISCEILYNGVKKTNTTHLVQGTNVGGTRMYVGNNVSTSTDYVNSLGIKLMLRDPTNPSFIMPLITRQVKENESFVTYCERFAQQVRDSIYAIING